jgi:transcriptional regulator with XRE-family HTH domain
MNEDAVDKKVNPHIGQNVKFVRTLFDYKQEYMAHRLDISVSSYNQLEKSTKLDTARLRNIASIFGIDKLWLMDCDLHKMVENMLKRSPPSSSHSELKQDS